MASGCGPCGLFQKKRRLVNTRRAMKSRGKMPRSTMTGADARDMPTAAMLAGDFTAFASPACNAGVQRNLAAPFAGNRISPALFSQAALNITAKLPTTTDPCGLLQYGLPSAMDEGQYVTKIDYTINARHSLFGRHIATTQFSPPPFTIESAQQDVLATRIGGRDNIVRHRRRETLRPVRRNRRRGRRYCDHDARRR